MIRDPKSSTRWLPIAAGLLSTAVAWTAGCSSSSSSATDGGAGGDAATSSGSGGSSGGSGGGSGSGSSSGGSGSSSGATSAIIITQGSDGQGGLNGGVAAVIGEHYTSGAKCTTTMSGPCLVSDCSAVLGADADPGTIEDENAGTISVSGGSLTTPAMLTYGSDNTYAGVTQTSAIFAAGDTFQISAPGATFPKFSGTSAPAPGVITLTSPTPTAGALGAVYPIDLTKAATFTWSGGTAGAQVGFSVLNEDTGVLIECKFDAAAGTGTIPANLVAMFQPATTSSPVTLDVGETSSKDLGSGVSAVIQTTLDTSTFYATQP